MAATESRVMSDRRNNPLGRMHVELKRAETRAAYCANELARYLAGGPNLADPVDARQRRKLEADLKLAQLDAGHARHAVDLVSGRVEW